MIILTFTSEKDLLEFHEQIIELARHPTSPAELEVVRMFKHQTQQLWWLNYDDIVNNTSANSSALENLSRNVTKVELRDYDLLKSLGYLPADTVVNGRNQTPPDKIVGPEKLKKQEPKGK